MFDIVANMAGLPVIYGTRYGTELELEQVLEVTDYPYGIRTVEEDGSLRYGGREFISKPLTFEESVQSFESVMTSPVVVWEDKSKRCSERCSVHVHVNFLDVSLERTRNSIYLYFLLEPGFFHVVNESRQNNIYCVPLSCTNMIEKTITAPMSSVPILWHKYTAFNVKPLKDIGTIEFRHMHATENVGEFTAWLSYIDNWKNLDQDALTMSRPEVDTLFTKVFGFPPPESLKESLDNNHLMLKAAALNIDSGTIIQRIKEHKVCADSSGV